MRRKCTFRLVIVAIVFGTFVIQASLREAGSIGFPGSEIVTAYDCPTGKLFVLSVGLDKYELERHGTRFSVADARSLAESLRKRNPDQGKEIVLFDVQATRNNIENGLDEIARDVGPCDTFVFFYAGRGKSEVITDSRESRRDFYLLPYDGKPDSLETTAISGKELRSYFRRIRAKNQLLILDSCDSSFGFESLASSVVDQDQNVADMLNTNALFIGTDSVEYEFHGLEHGVITAAVLDGLSGRADYNQDGRISAREVESYLYGRMHELSVKYGSNSKRLVHPRTITRGNDFDLGNTDTKLEEFATAKRERSASANQTSNKNLSTADSNLSRTSEPVEDNDKEGAGKRQGTDYALLVANNSYDARESWRPLANPISDAEAIKARLIADYGFQLENVRVEKNLTRSDFYRVIREYKSRQFSNEDQLFIFFAGHGTVDRSTCNETNKFCDGYLVMKDSPADLTDETSDKFISIDKLISKLIDQIPCAHIFAVFDACYVGQIWRWKGALPVPSIVRNSADRLHAAPSGPFRLASFTVPEPPGIPGGQQERMYSPIPKNDYIKRQMKNRTRIIFTAGDRPVYDGKPGEHSPFAKYFLDALKEGGSKYGVLTTREIVVRLDALPIEPVPGSLSGSDGQFVFVKAEKR